MPDVTESVVTNPCRCGRIKATKRQEVQIMFGEKLKKLRTENRITQDELAEKLYVTRTAISKWETGKGYPSIDNLKASASTS